MLFATADVAAVMALFIPILAVGIGLASVITGNWRRAKVAEYRAVMVQGMIDKGFSAGEIERVLVASAVPPTAHEQAQAARRGHSHA